MSKFHKYSYHNILLILCQQPNASLVAGYTPQKVVRINKWKKLNRFVRKGEKGIAILAPRPYEKKRLDNQTGEEVTEKGIYFRTVYVFDIKQTDGEPLPEEPVWINKGDGGQELIAYFMEYADQLNTTVVTKDLTAQGISGLGIIELKEGMTPLGQASTLAHEFAHELMHPKELRTADRRKINELEAEAVAFVVLDHFGYKINSPNYIALHEGNREKLLACLKRISDTAQELIISLKLIAHSVKGIEDTLLQ